MHLFSQLEVLELILEDGSHQAGEQVASLGVGDFDEGVRNKVDKGVEDAQTVHVECNVLELVNVEVLDGGLAVGTDGHREKQGNVTNVGVDLEVGVQDGAQVEVQVSVDLDVGVAQVEGGGEGTVNVRKLGISNSTNVAQVGDGEVADLGLALDGDDAELGVDVNGLVGHVQGVEAVLRGKGRHNLVNKRVGVTRIVVGGQRQAGKAGHQQESELHSVLGQLEERTGHPELARDVYEKGIKNCPHSIPLWLSAAHLEEKVGGLSKARAVLTKARLKNPQNPELWLAAIRAEGRGANKKEAEVLMAKALQECPTSGRLWAAAIEMAPRPQRKMKSVDALKRCDHDAYVIAAVARLFWHDRKVDKARNWLNRAVTLAPDIGDFWALLYKFELQHGTEEQQHEVVRKCIAAEPRHGERWIAISKAVENAHIPVEAVLKKVVVALGKEENAAGNG